MVESRYRPFRSHFDGGSSNDRSWPEAAGLLSGDRPEEAVEQRAGRMTGRELASFSSRQGRV
jgi:hypothetical protein